MVLFLEQVSKLEVPGWELIPKCGCKSNKYDNFFSLRMTNDDKYQ